MRLSPRLNVVEKTLQTVPPAREFDPASPYTYLQAANGVAIPYPANCLQTRPYFWSILLFCLEAAVFKLQRSAVLVDRPYDVFRRPFGHIGLYF